MSVHYHKCIHKITCIGYTAVFHYELNTFRSFQIFSPKTLFLNSYYILYPLNSLVTFCVQNCLWYNLYVLSDDKLFPVRDFFSFIHQTFLWPQILSTILQKFTTLKVEQIFRTYFCFPPRAKILTIFNFEKDTKLAVKY